jgi:hypothetical protein
MNKQVIECVHTLKHRITLRQPCFQREEIIILIYFNYSGGSGAQQARLERGVMETNDFVLKKGGDNNMPVALTLEHVSPVTR